MTGKPHTNVLKKCFKEGFMENKEVAKHSGDIQLVSLCLFAEGLGYNSNNLPNKGSFFFFV